MKNGGLFGNILKPKLWLSLAFLVLLMFVSSQLLTVLHKKSDIDQEIAALREEAALAESQNSQLKKMIEYLQSEQFAEEQAKLKLGLKKDGEKVAVITGLDASNVVQSAVVSSSSSLTASDLKANWQRWLAYFLRPNHY